MREPGGVLGMLADKDYKTMLENLAPCLPRYLLLPRTVPGLSSGEDLQREARFHMDAEAAPSVPEALRAAVRYDAGENNLAGVVVCGSLYLAAESRPGCSGKQKNKPLPPGSNKICEEKPVS